jgi:hypothetical protein
MDVDGEDTNDSQNSILSGQTGNSSSSTQPNNKNTELIQTLNSYSEYLEFVNHRMPASKSRNSHSRTYCKHDQINRHKTRIETRLCKGHLLPNENSELDYKLVKCEVKWQCYRCSDCEIYEIFQYEKHVNGCEDITTATGFYTKTRKNLWPTKSNQILLK